MAERVFECVVRVTVENEEAGTPQQMPFTREELAACLAACISVDIDQESNWVHGAKAEGANLVAALEIDWDNLAEVTEP